MVISFLAEIFKVSVQQAGTFFVLVNYVNIPAQREMINIWTAITIITKS